jgi:uncharacterized protein YndB with AHSA1/START domain
MSKGLVAKASIIINTSPSRVWNALVNPNLIKKYMFGTTAISDWKKGSSIVWKGEWKGNKYEDKGIILNIEPEHLIQYSHFSPLSGKPDSPQNYHLVTIELSRKGPNTFVSLLQDNNETEQERDNSQNNWREMLIDLKKLLEHK